MAGDFAVQKIKQTLSRPVLEFGGIILCPFFGCRPINIF